MNKVEIISFGTEETNEEGIIVEFEARRGNDCISGYMYLEDADDEAPLHFYTVEGFENGTICPGNPHQDPYSHSFKSPEYFKDTKEKWENWETLHEEFFTDPLQIQFLVDFATENRTIERNGYSLKINEGAMMEAQIERASEEYAPGDYESYFGKIRFTFNGEPLKLDDDYELELLSKLEGLFDSDDPKGELQNGGYYIVFPKSFWKEEPDYIDDEEARMILEEYLQAAREVYVMQLSRDANIAQYGDMVEQAVEEDYTNDGDLYRLQRAIVGGYVEEFLISERFVLG